MAPKIKVPVDKSAMVRAEKKDENEGEEEKSKC